VGRFAFPRRAWALAGIATLALVMAIQLQGCTVVGLISGSALDERNGHGGVEFLATVRTGRPVTLTLWDGRTVHGRYLGWHRDSTVTIPAGQMVSARGAILRIDTREGETEVPAEAVTRVAVAENGGKIIGLVAGLAMDAIVITTLKHDLRESTTGCRSSGSPPSIVTAPPDSFATAPGMAGAAGTH
jgi:hypothetical protein